MSLDLRLDQEYLRSTPVNSEEGAPMGIGVWYEMFISDPVAYLFKNADPRGSLARQRRQLHRPLLKQSEARRHAAEPAPMSQTVRDEVSPQSQEWGYSLGSAYIRKVHFRDAEMIKQIEEKVVNRLRQVTAAIKQDGANQVNIITSTAEQQPPSNSPRPPPCARKSSARPSKRFPRTRRISDALFETLETQNIIEGQASITLIPKNSKFLGELVASQSRRRSEALRSSKNRMA